MAKSYRPVRRIADQEIDMNNSYRALITAALTIAGLLAAAQPGQAQLPKDPAEREKVIAQIMQANARQITLFDRSGAEVGTVGSKDLYNQPVLSPDNKRVAVIKADLSIEKENNDLWIFDVATGKGTQITVSREREQATSPAWSPDGSQIA